MIPNLDLILVGLLYLSFIACVLLASLFVILICLFLAFSITLFTIVIIDLDYLFSIFSCYFVSLEASLDLGFVLILCTVMKYGIQLFLGLKPFYKRMASQLKVTSGIELLANDGAISFCSFKIIISNRISKLGLGSSRVELTSAGRVHGAIFLCLKTHNVVSDGLLHEEFDVAFKCIFFFNLNVYLNFDEVRKLRNVIGWAKRRKSLDKFSFQGVN